MIVKTYSRKDFVENVTYNVDDYYICINATGGPRYEQVFKESKPNIFNTRFDDTEYNRRKWSDCDQLYFDSIAITYEQADDMYEFISKIPSDATVHIHCALGYSRSGAVAQFLQEVYGATIVGNKVFTPNQRVLNFLYNAKDKYIRPIKFNVELTDILNYYHILEEKYQHLKWSIDYVDQVHGAEKHVLDGVYGWGIQSNLEDLSKPCPPYDVHKNKIDEYRDTELVFGIINTIKDRFPYCRQLGIAVHPPGTIINEHIDNTIYTKIHIPIISSPESYFTFNGRKFVMDPGRAYLIDTRYMHGTNNQGNTNRVHFLLKLPIDKMEDALK